MKLAEIRRIAQSIPRSYIDENADQLSGIIDKLVRDLGLDPKNLYQELEMTSRYVDTHRDISHSNTQMNLHSHTFYELLYCRNTCGAEYLAGTQRYRLQRGDIILIPPGVSHRPILPEIITEPYKRYIIWFSSELVDMIRPYCPFAQEQGMNDLYLMRTAGTPWEFLGDYFRIGVREAEQQKPGWEAVVLGNTIQVLIQLQRLVADRSAIPLRAEKPELLDQILAYIESHLADRLTLEDIAGQFWISESTISQTFRQKMGVSFHRCVTQRRLIAAKSLILDGLSLEDVARLVGFTDYSTFYRAFRQEYGISPRHYRKMQLL